MKHFEGAMLPSVRVNLIKAPLGLCEEDVARREWQNPSIHERMGARGLEYYIRYRVRSIDVVDGKPVVRRREKWHVLGPVTMGRRKAEREKDRIMREVNGQIYSLQSHVPFESFLEIWRKEYYRGVRQISRNVYEQRIRAWIEPSLHGRKLGQITRLDVARVLSAMEDAGVARNTRCMTRAVMVAIFDSAKNWGYLNGDNPAAGAEVGRSEGNTRKLWTPTLDEAQGIIWAAEPPVDLVLSLILWTGMRISEVLGLRGRDVNIEDASVIVEQRNYHGEIEAPKSKAANRKLALGSLLEQVKPLLAGPDDLVFRTPHYQTMYRMLQAALTATGHNHPGSAWHAFRRTHLTLMASKLSLFDLRAQAGHAAITTTQRYVTPDAVARRTAVEDAQKVVEMPRKRSA